MNYKNNEWNSWTSKSAHIPFKSNMASVGDGELKIAIEFGVQPLGQNFSHDLDIFDEKWEVKKLDSDDSFRLGVKVSTHYTPIISSVIRILEKIINITPLLLNSETKNTFTEIANQIISNSGRSGTLLLDGLRKNEVSASNLDKANDIIEILKKIPFEDRKISLYNSYNGQKQDYSLLDAFIKLSIENISVEEKVKILGSKEIYNILAIKKEFNTDLSIFKEKSLREILNEIVRNVFSSDIKLVLTHEEYGFKPITNLENIYCNRITSGLPRCKLIK